MDKISTELLVKSYEHYLQTGNSHFEFVTHNGDEFFHYSEAAKYLAQDGFINAVSDNIFADTVDIFDTTLTFNISPRGIQYVKSLKGN